MIVTDYIDKEHKISTPCKSVQLQMLCDLSTQTEPDIAILDEKEDYLHRVWLPCMELLNEK